MKTTPYIVLIDGKPVGIYDMPVPTKPLYEMTASVTIKPTSEVVSIWDTRSWIAPEKSINKIAKY